jgi:soluble lytic murein transglycosylase-like protein
MMKQLVVTISLLCCLTLHANAQRVRKDLSLLQRARLLEPFITEAARSNELDPRILRLICLAESRFRIDAVSAKGARGPMQFMPETAKRFGVRNPHDPREAMHGASRYLRFLLRRFGGRLDLALASYNAGEGTVESFLTGKPLLLQNGKLINPRGITTGGLPPYPETRMYVYSILKALNKTQAAAILPSRSLKLYPCARNYTLDVTTDSENQIINSAHQQCGPSFLDIK